jgi:hypothetical protein
LGSDYVDKLDVDFTIIEVKEVALSMKNNKATGCNGIPVEAWKIKMKELKF